MLMSPFKLVVFRTLNLTLSRFRLGDRLLRDALEAVVVRKASEPYCQSADFFSYDQLSRPADGNRGEAR